MNRKLRKLIEEQNGRAAERRNDAKAKLRAAKAKVLNAVKLITVV